MLFDVIIYKIIKDIYKGCDIIFYYI